MTEGIESAASDDQKLLSAMEELQRAQQRVAQLREQNRAKAIADVIEKIKMYDLKPEELGFSKGTVLPKAGRQRGSNRSVPPAFPVPGTALTIEGASVDRRSQVKPKYRSPDGKDTWSGRGKPPLWMQALLDAGAKKEDFEVDRSDTGAAE